MTVVTIDKRGRVCIPKDVRIEAEKALLIPLGASYMVIPIPKTPTAFPITKPTSDLRRDAENAIRREVRERLERRGQKS